MGSRSTDHIPVKLPLIASTHFPVRILTGNVLLTRWETDRQTNFFSLVRPSFQSRGHLSVHSTDQLDFLLRFHRLALCHSEHLASIPQCSDSCSQQWSQCPHHSQRDCKGCWVALVHLCGHPHVVREKSHSWLHVLANPMCFVVVNNVWEMSFSLMLQCSREVKVSFCLTRIGACRWVPLMIIFGLVCYVQ